MTTWAFNVGDGDTLLVETDKLSDAARAVEGEWGGMINGCMREGCARHILHWDKERPGRACEAREITGGKT